LGIFTKGTRGYHSGTEKVVTNCRSLLFDDEPMVEGVQISDRTSEGDYWVLIHKES